MDIANLCGNCKHFNRHYVKRKCQLKITAFGHCSGRRISRIRTDDDNCEKWEPSETDGTPDKDIEELLKDMAKKINDIALILNSD